MYITITGTKYFFGNSVYKVGQIVRLIKEYENEYDDEAIAVYNEHMKIGYVANSVHTVARGTHSSGYVFHMIHDQSKAKILFISKDTIIAQIIKDYSLE